ncbi:hypothetical protein Emag_007370 [Eimeria magna]
MIAGNNTPGRPTITHWDIIPDEEARYLHETFSKPLSEGIAATIKSDPAEKVALREAAAKAATGTQATTDERHLTPLDKQAFPALQEAEWLDEELMGDLLNHLRKTLNATGVYFASYEEQAGLKDGELAPGLRYVAADNTHLHMLDQCLMEDEGVTWDLLREEQPTEAPAETSDSSGASEDEDEEGRLSTLSDVRPEFAKMPPGSIVGHLGTSLRLNTLFVEEVMENPRIRFFGLTRPGSYAAVSLEFDSAASSTSVATLCAWLEKKQSKEQSLISAQKCGETAHGDIKKEVGENEDALESEESPLAPVQLPLTPAKYILCVDFLGSEAPSRLPTMLRLKDFAKELASALMRTQIKAVERQENAAGEELAQLLQKCADKLEALQQVRQAQALESLEAEEAKEASERALKSSRKDAFPAGKDAHGSAREETEQREQGRPTDDEDAQESIKQVAEEDSMEQEPDATDEPLVSFQRDLVVEAARAHAALDVFNAEVLSFYKPTFSLCRPA